MVTTAKTMLRRREDRRGGAGGWRTVIVLQEQPRRRAGERNRRRGEELGGKAVGGLKRSDKAAHGGVSSLPRHRQRQRMLPLHTLDKKSTITVALWHFLAFSAAQRLDFPSADVTFACHLPPRLRPQGLPLPWCAKNSPVFPVVSSFGQFRRDGCARTRLAPRAAAFSVARGCAAPSLRVRADAVVVPLDHAHGFAVAHRLGVLCCSSPRRQHQPDRRCRGLFRRRPVARLWLGAFYC